MFNGLFTVPTLPDEAFIPLFTPEVTNKNRHIDLTPDEAITIRQVARNIWCKDDWIMEMTTRLQRTKKQIVLGPEERVVLHAILTWLSKHRTENLESIIHKIRYAD
jgi:hypothetical protein